MTISIAANAVCLCAFIVFVCWVYSEIKKCKTFSRISLGIIATVLISIVSILFFQTISKTREHYFRTTLIELAKKIKNGEDDFVCKELVIYASKTKDKDFDDMGAILYLYNTLQEHSNKMDKMISSPN